MATTKKNDGGFSAQERAAMQERAKELKAEQKRSKNRADGEAAVQEKLAEMSGSDREIVTRLHELITDSAPDLMPKTWYGMPAYANADNKIVVFVQSAEKFEARYVTLGFNDAANLDDASLWPTAYAITKLTAANEKAIRALVKQAAS